MEAKPCTAADSAILRIFSSLYLAAGQLFLTVNNHCMSQIALSLNQPNYMNKISHFATQNIEVAGVLLPQSVSWFVLLCDSSEAELTFQHTKVTPLHKQSNRSRQR